MTLKKFIKKKMYSRWSIMCLFFEGSYIGAIDTDGSIKLKNTTSDIDYRECKIKKFYPVLNNYGDPLVCIQIAKPQIKKSNNQKKYKKWAKEYTKNHMDKLGLRDDGYDIDAMAKNFVKVWNDDLFK